MSKFEYEPHTLSKMYKAIPWLVCRYCGLVYLKNAPTQWAIRKGCNWRDAL